MGRHIVDALPAQPDLGLSVTQTGQILSARTCRHDVLLVFVGQDFQDRTLAGQGIDCGLLYVAATPGTVPSSSTTEATMSQHADFLHAVAETVRANRPYPIADWF